MIPRHHALHLLSLCDGEEIWSREYCRQQRVPESWIDELTDAYESGFQRSQDTIFVGSQRVNQYEGVRAVDLAIRLGEVLGVNIQDIRRRHVHRAELVRAIMDEVEEG